MGPIKVHLWEYQLCSFMFEDYCPRGLGERWDFGSLVIFALSSSQRRSFDSLCPRQLLPVISFTKGLLPRTPVNQQKLYIQRKLKPFSGSPGTSQEGAMKRFQLLLNPAAAASTLQGLRIQSNSLCSQVLLAFQHQLSDFTAGFLHYHSVKVKAPIPLFQREIRSA